MIIKFIKKKINLIKICAVFTTVCFVVSTLGANLYAIPLAENANQKYEDVFNKVSSISAEYGKITSSKDAQSDITVINIQDLHCHPQTQRNISKIITQIADKYNLKKIYVEGGYGDIDVSWLDTIKDEKIKRQIIEGLLEEGILTGSEYYKLTNNNEVELKGIDEEQIHKDNVRRLSWIIENQSKYRDVITKVENEINILEKMYVNSRNERFNRDIEKYLTSKIDSRRFYRQLAKYVRDINENPEKYNNITAIRLEDYPNITKFIALRKTSKDIDVKEVTQQLQMVINELKNKLPYNVYTKLLSETENLSDSQKVVELITMLCNKEGIDLENKYKSLHTFLESNGINRELNTVELVQEERQLLSEIRKALSYNNEEYEITFVSDFSKYFKDYLEYKLTDADWKYFEKEFDQFITLYSKYATVNRIQEIYGDFDELNKYYKINDQRNNVFVANLLKDEEISVSETDRVRQEEEILKNSKEVIIAVTGGFHSSELEEILAKKEVNTIVITPSIFEGIEKATKQYKGIIKDQSRFFQHQALAYTLASCSSTDYQKNLLYSMAKDILGGNVERLKEVFGGNVDLTVFDNLKPLTEQEQEQISDQKNLIAVAASIMVDFLPKQGGMTVLRPNTDSVILEISEKLVSEGIFLSKGPVFGAEEAGLPTLNGISPEVYSRMHTVIQEALLAAEGFSAEESYTESVTEEESVEEIEETEVSTEKEETEDKVDSSYLSEERKAELLGRFYNNNREAFYRLINICCRQSVQFDLSKDSALLDMFIRKYNSYGYDLDTMDEIIRRSVHVAKTFFFDTDLKFAAFEKFVDFFDDDSIDKNGEVEYIKYFRRLFALNQEYLKLFYEKIDGLSATDLVFYYEAEDINVGLNYLFKKFGKEITKLGEYDYIRLVDLFDNIEKLNYLSEEEFSYLMSLPNEIFSYVLKISADSSQLKTKLKVGRKYGDKKYDETLSKSIFANAEKLENLSVLYFIPFTNLNKEALIFILDNARNSSDIEKILSLCKGMGLSTQFDKSGSVNDFVDPRFKALVKYISIGDRDFYSKLFDYGSKTVNLIVDSVDAEFVRDYIFNPNYEEIYKKLFVGLVDLEIKSLAVENDYFALKLILNKDFNRILTESRLDNISDRDNIVARYYSAIAVSRMVYDGARQEVSDYSFENEKFASLMQKATSIYIRMMKAMLNVILIDSNTKIYALCNSERLFAKDRFNIDSLREIIEYMGIPIDIPEENVYKRLGNNDNASKMWLQAIENFIIDSDKTKGYFVFRGHGGEESLLVYDPGVRQNGLATGHKAERITPEQLADSLFKLATREQNPVNLKNITIDLSCCNSYFFARNVYDILEQKFRAENKAESYPTIITAAGLETKTGITDFRRMEGNLHKGINKLLRNFQRGSIPVLSLGMIGLSEYLFTESNITMFTSFFDKNLLKDISEIKREIYDYVNYEQVSRKEEVKISEEKEDDSEREKEKRGKLSAFLPTSVTEASVFGADKAAPVWEEVIYRAIPAMIFTGIVIAATMFFPAIPAVAIIAKMVCIGIFSFFQTRFVAAHIVTDWVKAKDSGGPLVLRNLLENKDLTVKGKISKLLEIIKERILVIFPSSVLEKEFSIFYKTDNRADLHKKGLIIPTVTFTIPYIIAMIFFNSMPAVAIATIVSMIFHYINNKVAKTLEEKELLQEKAITKDFHDIQRRLRHVKLLIENPQVKVDLPVIKEGSFAIKFGLENIEERRAEYLLEYEKVRINFVERLNWEMAQAETVKNELERIGSKKRKTKKDREKIEELKEQLRRIENEYPKIKSELLFTDTKKVEEIIDKIDELLPIFEELDIILTMMENFIAANGDTKESRELEREFLEFAEQTFMKKLMSLYDAKVTGVHVRRVVSFSNLIGRNMPFGNNLRMMYKLMLSSILHDIGKNLVPEVILNKQGSFNELERDMMEFHVVFGGLILRSSILKELSYTAENHHFTKESSPKSYSYKTKMDYMFGSSHYEYDEEEAQIAKVVTLTDVYEAVSPKLSFATERTYQFARKIRDISNILENIDVGLNESQQKRVIALLSEIAQIENEEDIPKRQEMEQKFIKKVLYSHSKDIIINYIREQNNELVRENAFKIIFTESPQYIFNKLGKTRAEFLDDFKNDPKGTVDKCMSLVDNSNFEFDTEVVRAFLEFYFSYGDVRINDSILESLNKERENAFVVFIKDKSYSLYRIFKKFRTTVMMYAPIIASIFPEEGVSVKEKFNIDTDIIGHDVVIKKRNGDTNFLHFDEKDFRETGRNYSGVKNGLSSYGIQEIKYDEDGKIVDIILELGAEIDSDTSKTKMIEGSETDNLSFADIEEQIKENYERKHHHKLEQEGFLLKSIMEDAGVTETVEIYLDDDVKSILAAIEDAIDNNKLMVIHVFKKGFTIQNLSLWQRYQKYIEVYSLLDSKSKFESTLSKSSTAERQYIKQVEEGLTDEEKKDMEWTKKSTATTYFALREILKNNFDHGNLGLFEYPIALHISKDSNGRVTEFSTYNLSTKPITLDRTEEQSLKRLMYEAYISGSHKGTEYMTDSFFTNLKYGDDIKVSVGEEVYRIYRTKVTLKTEQEQEQALEKYNQYKEEQAEKRRQYEEASAEKKKEIEEQEKKRNLAAFWEDFFSILKPLGLKRDDRPYIWEEGFFRYLPTALILSHVINPIVGIGVQLLFISAHSIVKWSVARKTAKEKGEKEVGIGDLFKQVGKDIKNLGLPTLAIMLPYVGTLLAFAINPALSILITPAFFMFADVIVQWITKKDSGGKITINKNLVVAAVISSLLAYTLLPAIPVINPLVNALINPVLAVNTAGAGYLHYEYNKRQENRGKLLSIISVDENEDEVIDGSDQIIRAKSRRENKGLSFNIKEFFNKKGIEILHKDGSEISFDFVSRYKMPENYEENYKIKKAKNYCTWDNKIYLDGGSIVMIDLSLEDGYEFVNGEDKTIDVVRGGSNSVKIWNVETEEEITIELSLNNDGKISGTVSHYSRVDSGRRVSDRSIASDRDTTRDLDENLKETFGVEKISYEYDDVNKKYSVEVSFKDGTTGAVELPSDDRTVYLNHGDYIFCFNRQYCAPINIYEIDTTIFTKDTSLNAEPTDFIFNTDVLYADMPRGYRLNDFTDRKFIIRNGDSEYMLYFDSKDEVLYEFTNDSVKRKLNMRKLEDYGIINFQQRGGKITELLLAEGVNMQIDVRQPIEIKTDADIEAMMIEFALNQDMKLIDLSNRSLRDRLYKIGMPEEQFKNRLLAAGLSQTEVSKIDFNKANPLEALDKNIMKSINLNNGVQTLGGLRIKRIFSDLDLERDIIEAIIEEVALNQTMNLADLSGSTLRDRLDKVGMTEDKFKSRLLAAGLSQKQIRKIDFNKANPLEDIAESAMKNIVLEGGLQTQRILDTLPRRLKMDVTMETRMEELVLSQTMSLISLSNPNLRDRLNKVDISEEEFKNILLAAGFPETEVSKIDFNKANPLEDVDQNIMKSIVLNGGLQTQRNLDDLNIEQVIPMLKMACPSLTDAELKRIARTRHLDEDIREKIQAVNYQGNIRLEDIDLFDEQKLQDMLKNNPMIYSMFLEALFRTAIALDLIDKSKQEKDVTLDQLIDAIHNVGISKKFFETQLRGYFGEIYCTKTIVAGVFDGMTLRLQMPDDSNEPGIDLIDPVTGTKIQVKTGDSKIVKGHLSKNWKTRAQDTFFRRGFGRKMIPVLTVTSVKNNPYGANEEVQSFGIESKTITEWIKYLLDYKTNGKNLDKIVMRSSLADKLKIIDEDLPIRASVASIKKKFEIGRVARQQSPEFSNVAILPENIGLVNRIMQSTFGNAFIAATVIAVKEFRASLEPNFVDLHQTAAGKRGAQQVASLANRYNITEQDSITAKIIKSILGIIFKGASIVKHIAIDYRYIKASGIQEAINMFGKDAILKEDGQIEVAIVEDIELLQDSFTLVNTGLKVDGASIYRIKNTDLLMYGAKGQQSIKIVKTLNDSNLLNEDIIEMLRANGENVDEIQAQAMATKSGEGISVTDDIIEIGEMELTGKSPEQVKQFVASALEIKRVMGIMYGQKTIIDLKSVTDIEKLRATVYNGRARKVISKAQYENLNLTEAEIEQLKQEGIEIYIDNGEIVLSEAEVKDYKNKGIAGQIIRDKDGIKIKDYSTEEETKIEEILEDQNIESKILTAETPILIGIDILTKHFKQGNVTAVQREFGALLGKIKMSLNLGELNSNDIEYMGYNINFNRIPTLTQEQIDEMFEKVGDELQIVDKAKLIEIIGPETEFAIILKTIKNKDAEKRLKEIVAERILAKTALTENNKEFGLKDKNLEILLGRMLLAQVNNTDKQRTNISDNFKGSMNEVMEKIKEETEKAMQKDEVAINTIIELILAYGDNYKEKQIARDIDKNDIRNYRAMMSAA
ncbi:HD-GYP domain-containing protein [Candidatus Ruminimicrobiellum ovillum]|uniref:HD-GYP domain-containing protein n=1 Tax=Candidatus Ruminimicrobiellum ovillum TaxID=1947927 RepID=UPI00355A8FEC